MARLLAQVLLAERLSFVTGILVNKARVASRAGSFVSPIAGCEGIDCVKQYVTLDDAEFSWHDTQHRVSGCDRTSGVNWTGYILNMTSQRWITENPVSFPVWWHIIVVVVPANLEARDWATFHVEFGKNTMAGLRPFSNRDPSGKLGSTEVNGDNLEVRLPDIAEAVWSSAQMAASTRAVAVSLFNALNQYETFAHDQTHEWRTGDHIKAYTWFDYLLTGATQPERIMELPVAKAVVRGIDAASAFTASLRSGEVTKFGVYGHSKFGTATWMAGAVDSRVKAIAPTALLFDQTSLVAHGGNPALLQDKSNPYDALKYWRGTEALKKLMMVVCPMNWMHTVSMPKLVIMDTNDVWMDDAIRDVGLWWPDLPEPKNLLFAEAHHDTVTILTMSSAVSFFRGVMMKAPMPRIDYAFDWLDGKAHVYQRSAHAPMSVHLYFAVSCRGGFPVPRFLHSEWSKELVWSASPKARDGTTGQWTVDLYHLQVARALADFGFNSSGVCSRGAFMEVEYEWPLGGLPFKLTTPVFLVPMWSTQSSP